MTGHWAERCLTAKQLDLCLIGIATDDATTALYTTSSMSPERFRAYCTGDLWPVTLLKVGIQSSHDAAGLSQAQ